MILKNLILSILLLKMINNLPVPVAHCHLYRKSSDIEQHMLFVLVIINNVLSQLKYQHVHTFAENCQM